MLNPVVDSVTLVTIIGICTILCVLVFTLIDAKEFL